MLAQRLGAWVPLEEVPEVWAGVVGVFRDYGYRRLRSRARLKFLVADWGVERFRQVLEGEYLKRSLIDGPAPELPASQIDHRRDPPAARRPVLRGGRAGRRPVTGTCWRRWPTSRRRTAAPGCA
jgi:sulfite reductase beta subunit-like hemoprotein